ncbi:MAG: hypothetical protein KDB53_19610 [Planctomycetes bacterium]|nr:hypothetical protein [Planctomycetota bacterium]
MYHYSMNKIGALAIALVLSATCATAQITLDGTQAQIGGSFDVTVSGGHPNSLWMLGIDRSSGPTTFQDVGITVDLGFTQHFLAVNNQTCDGSGNGSLTFAMPTDNVFAGIVYYVQALNVDPMAVTSITVSNLRTSTVHPSDPGLGTQSMLGLTDDGSAQVSLGFSFPFYGQSYTQAFVNANGSVSFGQANGSSTVDESFFVGGPATIAPLFTDLNPELGGTVVTDTTATPGQAFAVRFNGVDDNFASGPSSFTVTLYVGGHIAIDYDTVGPATGAIVGCTPGGSAMTNDIDLSQPGFLAHASPSPFYQVFTAQAPFDLSNSFVLFGRVGTSGYLSLF